MIVIDEARIFEIISEKNPASVALNGPEGMLPQVQRMASHITERFGIPAYIIADTTWGACDLNTAGAATLSAGILFNIGHTINAETYDHKTYMIDAFDDISFDGIAKKLAPTLYGKKVALLTDSQHLRQVGSVRRILEEGGVHIITGKGRGQLNDAQVFGCEFYTATGQGAEACAFLGQSSFHAAGVALSTGLPTYMMDPYFNEIREVGEFARKLQKKATLAIYKAAEAHIFGVIVGLRDGQLSKSAALKFKCELEKEGKKVHLFAMTDITAERLRRFPEIEAFVQVACPRISTDNHFDVPVLSSPQAAALLKIMRGEDPGEYLQIPHWL